MAQRQQGAKLSVNLNKVALLRNQRPIGYPSVVETARRVIDAGAHGITVHPRPDERHVRRSDVGELAALVASDYRGRIELNVEGNPTADFLDLVCQVRPDQVTLVPDDPHQATSDHGWDLARDGAFLSEVVARLQGEGIRVSLFVDCEAAAMPLAKGTGADRVELYTGPYAVAYGTAGQDAAFAACRDAGLAAAAAGLGLNAGHDLNLENLPPLVAALPALAEVSIGHAITADALCIGFPAAVAAYLKALEPQSALVCESDSKVAAPARCRSKNSPAGAFTVRY